MNQLQEELLSAYLDGELSAGEKADVERLLAADPNARQLLGELRALNSAVRNLPTYRLDENFSSQVLRAAERQMLSGDPPANVDRMPASTSIWKPTLRRVLKPRNLLWPAVAVAVAILLAVFNPQRANQPGGQGGGEVAINPPGEPPTLQPGARQDHEKSGPSAKEPGSTIAQKNTTDTPAAEATAEGLLVVRCRITADAARQQAFDQLLAKEQVKGRVSNDPTGALRRMVGESGDTQPVGTQQGPKPVFVQAEATAAQIDAIVAHMKAHPGQFPAATLKPRGPESKPGQGKREVLFVLEIVK